MFAVDPRTRQQHLHLPRAARVDFRAACFCHKRPVDLGYVCSACLSIFCRQLPACTTCGTEFSSEAAAAGGGVAAMGAGSNALPG